MTKEWREVKRLGKFLGGCFKEKEEEWEWQIISNEWEKRKKKKTQRKKEREEKILPFIETGEREEETQIKIYVKFNCYIILHMQLDEYHGDGGL